MEKKSATAAAANKLHVMDAVKILLDSLFFQLESTLLSFTLLCFWHFSIYIKYDEEFLLLFFSLFRLMKILTFIRSIVTVSSVSLFLP